MLDRVATSLEGRMLARYRAQARNRSRRASIAGELVELETGVVRVQRRGSGGHTIVMAPDPPNVVEHHRELVDDLATDHQVFCFDMAGFGYSYLRDGLAYGVENHCRLLRELFDQLGIRNATLSVACLSGLAAMTFAARNPGYVARLVLVQVPSPADAQRWIRFADVFGAIRTPVVGQLFMHALRRKVLRQWYRSALPEPIDEARYESFLALSNQAFDAGGGFSLASAYRSLALREPIELPVATPQLHVWGGNDRTHHRNQTNHASLLDGMSDARSIEFPSCGHFPNLEERAAFSRALREFEAATER